MDQRQDMYNKLPSPPLTKNSKVYRVKRCVNGLSQVARFLLDNSVENQPLPVGPNTDWDQIDLNSIRNVTDWTGHNSPYHSLFHSDPGIVVTIGVNSNQIFQVALNDNNLAIRNQTDHKPDWVYMDQIPAQQITNIENAVQTNAKKLDNANTQYASLANSITGAFKSQSASIATNSNGISSEAGTRQSVDSSLATSVSSMVSKLSGVSLSGSTAVINNDSVASLSVSTSSNHSSDASYASQIANDLGSYIGSANGYDNHNDANIGSVSSGVASNANDITSLSARMDAGLPANNKATGGVSQSGLDSLDAKTKHEVANEHRFALVEHGDNAKTIEVAFNQLADSYDVLSEFNSSQISGMATASDLASVSDKADRAAGMNTSELAEVRSTVSNELGGHLQNYATESNLNSVAGKAMQGYADANLQIDNIKTSMANYATGSSVAQLSGKTMEVARAISSADSDMVTVAFNQLVDSFGGVKTDVQNMMSEYVTTSEYDSASAKTNRLIMAQSQFVNGLQEHYATNSMVMSAAGKATQGYSDNRSAITSLEGYTKTRFNTIQGNTHVYVNAMTNNAEAYASAVGTSAVSLAQSNNNLAMTGFNQLADSLNNDETLSASNSNSVQSQFNEVNTEYNNFSSDFNNQLGTVNNTITNNTNALNGSITRVQEELNAKIQVQPNQGAASAAANRYDSVLYIYPDDN